jgi:hypothetical protein
VMGVFIRPFVFLEVPDGVQRPAGFQKGDFEPELGQDVHRRAAACAGTDYHDVEDLGRSNNLSAQCFRHNGISIRLPRSAAIRPRRP